MSIRFQQINLDEASKDGLVMPVKFSGIGLAQVTDPTLQIRAHLDDAQDYIPLIPGMGWEGIAADKVRIHWDAAPGHRANLVCWGPRSDRPQIVRPVEIGGAFKGWSHAIGGTCVFGKATFATSGISTFTTLINAVTPAGFRYVIQALRSTGAAGSSISPAFQILDVDGVTPVFASEFGIASSPIMELVEFRGVTVGPGQQLQVQNRGTGVLRCEVFYKRIPATLMMDN